MTDLLNETPAAVKWVKAAIEKHSNGIFGEVVPAVLWTDTQKGNGALEVPIDPSTLVLKFNSAPTILLHNHDPGKPKGQVLESSVFKTDAGRTFVAAVIGYYEGGDVLSFKGLNIDLSTPAASPTSLPDVSNRIWIEFATDPREVDEEWISEVLKDAPLRVERTELSHNAEDSHQELIRIGLSYAFLVWNPLVTSVASEAGKAVFAKTRDWLRKLIKHLADRRNPIVALQAFQDNCQVSFLIRGKEVKRLYAAQDALPSAAAKAAQLVDNFKARGIPARDLSYEFDDDALKWYPSHAILKDGRIVTDKGALISMENLPKELSLGIKKGMLKPASKADSEKHRPD